MEIVALFGFMFILIFLGMDIALAMVVSAFLYLILPGLGGGAVPLTIVPQQMMEGADSFSLTAIPLFILVGNIMNRGEITSRLVRFAQSLVGHLRGGLAHTSVITNMTMAGMSGSAVADATATGSILVPAMKEAKYEPKFSAAIIAAASTIGPVIPPSIPLIIVGATAQISIGKLFFGGVIPGAIMGLILMSYIGVVAKKRNFPKEERVPLRQVLLDAVSALLPLGLPVVVLGSILIGATTPTESAVMGVLYATVLTVLIYRTLRLRDFLGILADSAVLSAAIMFIISAGVLFGWIATSAQLGFYLTSFLTDLTTSPVVMLLIINLVLLLLGMVIEAIPIILLTTPIFFPIIEQLGIDPVLFGVLMVVNLMIGLLTPPIGLHLFITSGIANVPIGEVISDSWPMVVALLLVVLLIILFPPIVLWLPGVLMG